MRLRLLFPLVALVAVGTPLAADINVRDTRLLHQPATSGTHVAFVYADDLWVARIDGTDLRRLTTDDGLESNPAFSPDGTTDRVQRAVRRQHATSTSCPSRAACRKRLTWHPGPDVVQGFTPDGRQRAVHVGARGVHEPIHAAVHGAARRRHARRAADPERGERRLLARRPAHRLQPARAALRAVEAVSRRHGRRASGSTTPRRQRSRRCRSRRRAPTTWMRRGSAARCTSAPIATASSTCFPTTRGSKAVQTADDAHDDFPVLNARRRRRQDRLRAGRLSASVRSGHERRAQKLTIGVPSDLRETRARFVQGRATGFATPPSRRPARAPCSNSAARS